VHCPKRERDGNVEDPRKVAWIFTYEKHRLITVHAIAAAVPPFRALVQTFEHLGLNVADAVPLLVHHKVRERSAVVDEIYEIMRIQWVSTQNVAGDSTRGLLTGAWGGDQKGQDQAAPRDLAHGVIWLGVVWIQN
jgi:hypothetical protein